jgi:hypothetical protein
MSWMMVHVELDFMDRANATHTPYYIDFITRGDNRWRHEIGFACQLYYQAWSAMYASTALGQWRMPTLAGDAEVVGALFG